MNISIRNIHWKPKAFGVIAKAALVFTDVGLELRDVPILLEGRRLSAALPRRHAINGKGRSIRSVPDVEIMAFYPPINAQLFSSAVIGEIKRLLPGRLESYVDKAPWVQA